MTKCTICKGKKIKTATYGEKGCKAIYCKTHATEAGPLYVDVVHQQCIEPDCTKRPWKRTGVPASLYCSNHCVDGIVGDIMEKLTLKVIEIFEPTLYRFCRNIDCSIKKKRAHYGIELNKPLFCDMHRDKTIHKDVRHSMCIITGCGIRAGFGEPNKPPIYCGKHGELKGFGSITKRECIADGCTTTSLYALEGESPKYCSKCADHETMVDVVTPRCFDSTCFKRRRYGFEKDMKPLYCAQHANRETMKDVLGGKCKFEGGCGKQRRFGFEKDKKALYCGEHADRTTMVDVVNPRCKNEGCMTQPIFGIKGGPATHCLTHYDPKTMRDVNHKLCDFMNCGKRPTFGTEKGIAIYCDTHAVGKGMDDVLNPRCIECHITTVNRNYKPHCSSCFYNLNPYAERTINFKTKELAFTQALREMYPSMILDKIIKGGRSKFRPDALLDVGTHCVMLEIDEGQHSGYDNDAEGYRLQSIHADIGSRGLTVIRLNPDSYKNVDKRIKGCYHRKKATNTLVRNDKEFKRRLDVLKTEVSKAVATPPEVHINVIPLFFNITVDSLSTEVQTLSIN